MSRTVRRFGIVVLALTVALAAPAGTGMAQQQPEMTQEIVLTITADGEVETFWVGLSVSDSTYQAMESGIPEEYDSVAAALAADLVANEPVFGGYEDAADVATDDGYRLEITFVEANESAMEGFSLEASGDQVRFAVTDLDQLAVGSDLEEYLFTVEMPGEITETTADETTDGTATWNLTDSAPDAVAAESTLDADDGSDQDGTDENSSEPDDDGSSDGDQTVGTDGGGDSPAGDDGATDTPSDDDPVDDDGAGGDGGDNATEDDDSSDTPDEDDMPTDDSTNDSEDGESNESQENTDDSPGFGLAIALAGLLGGLHLARRS